MDIEPELFLVSYNETSKRHAILSDEGHAAFLYLHEASDDPNTTAPIDGDVIAYNRVALIEVKEVESYRPKLPPIAKGYGHAAAVINDPKTNEWKFSWSDDGLSVLLLKDGEPWCLLAKSEENGYSKVIKVAGPWGSPWDDSKAGELFLPAV